MNYLNKNVRNSKKLDITLNTNPKKHHIFISTLIFKSNLINQIKDTTSSNKNLNQNRRIFKIKDYPEENKSYENNTINKSTSTEIINKPNIITNYIKKVYLNSLNKERNKRIKQNKINNHNEDIKKDNLNSLYFGIKKCENEILDINNKIQKRYRHKQVKRENYISNNINNKYNKNNQINNNKSLYKKESLKSVREDKNKSITIPIIKRITYNIFNNSKKNKNIFDGHKNDIKQIKSYEKYKENIEQNNNNKSINYLKLKIFNMGLNTKKLATQNNKNNLIYKYKKIGKAFEYKYSQRDSIKDINKNYIKEKKNEKCNEIYFNENELNESNTKINKVLYFETSANELFNQFKINNKENLNLNKIHSCKNINDKKEICSTDISDINNDKGLISIENENIKNIKNIIKNNIDYNNENKKKNIIIRNNFLKFRKFKTDAILDTTHLQSKIKNSNKYDNKENNSNNSNINQNYFYTLESNTNSLRINKELLKKKEKLKCTISNLKNKRNKLLFHNLDLLYKLFENKYFAKILFSFCEKDIYLLNKVSLISKNIYKSIKPFIYSKISINIKKFNENNTTKNKIKLYLMQNNSSLLKLSPALLRKKYTDLIFENNKYDIDIKKDLTRTFPDDILFKYGNIYYNKLYHILTAFSNYNKNIGYVQGLNFIAAHIIYFFEDEIDEFTFLDAMIHKFELDKILDNNLNNQFFEEKLKNINFYLMKQLPKLNNFLSDNKLNLEFFTTSWILTLFSDSMQTEFLVIIWDYLIIFGMKFFKYFILNVLLLYENDILNSDQNNITYIKKNILKNEKFCNNNDILIKNTTQMMINDESII